MTKRFQIFLAGLVVGFSCFCQADSHGFLIGEHENKLQFSGGGQSDGQFAPLLGIAFIHDSYDFDLLYVQTNYGGGTSTYSSLEVPIFVRVPVGGIFVFGAGAYAAYMFNAPSGAKALDDGLGLSLQLMFSKSFFAEFRYLYGLVDLPGNTRDINVILGFGFGN